MQSMHTGKLINYMQKCWPTVEPKNEIIFKYRHKTNSNYPKTIHVAGNALVIVLLIVYGFKYICVHVFVCMCVCAYGFVCACHPHIQI